MENIIIAATNVTPKISFDFHHNKFEIVGESYPEDVKKFYNPILENLESHLQSQKPALIEFVFNWIYFNSSTVKILYRIFRMIEEAVEQNTRANIIWNCSAEDDIMQELGQEFAENFANNPAVQFQIKFI